MSEQKTDYGEVFCKAVDTILANRLDKLEFDVTKVCRITDNTYKKQGKYTVTDNSVKFEAYSTIYTLEVGDSVLVNIPQGDYGGQKTILNKIIQEEDPNAINYKSPLSGLLKFTDNIVKANYNTEYSILANNETKNDDGYVSGARKVPIAVIQWDENNEYQPFKRMGVGADFQTWLSSFETVSGTYGLRFEFMIIDKNGEKKVSHSFDLNVKDMLGNPYGFDVYVHQEKIFDISRIENANELHITLYQNSNFLDRDGQYIPYQSEGDPVVGTKDGELLNNNIFVKNLEIYFGYDQGAYTTDTLELTASPSKSYSAIAGDNVDKTLTLHWIHKIDDDNFEILDKDSIKGKVYDIYWCRQVRGISDDEIIRQTIGDNWSEKDPSIKDYMLDSDNPFKKIFTPDQTRPDESVKVACRLQNENGIWDEYTSNIITFSNTSYVSDEATVNQIMGLSINYTDESEGNYFIYNQSGEIINEGRGQGYRRLFEARFNGQPIESAVSNITKIIWELPIDREEKNASTMLAYKDSYYTGGNTTYKFPEGEEDNSIHLQVTREYKKEDSRNFSTQAYSIKNNWHESNTSNRVTCKLWADNTVYERSIELQFGKAGTSGTNLTLKIDYDNGENALSMDEFGNIAPGKIKATIYDMSGKKINMSDAAGKWTWQWYHTSGQDSNVKNFLEITTPDPSKEYEIQLTKDENFGSIESELLKENYNILELIYTPSEGQPGDDTATVAEEGEEDEGSTKIVSTQLRAYFPIAIKRKDQCSYMEGTRTVLYNTSGTLEHNTYTDAYVLYQDYEDGQPDKNLNLATDFPLEWKIQWDNTATDEDGNQVEIPDSYCPTLVPLVKEGSAYKALKPSSVYIKNFNDRACVYAEGDDGQVFWSQPLLIIQSDYGFPMVNQWTGETEVGETSVKATTFCAGSKDDSNKFSGLIMGDLKGLKDLAGVAQTGLYGFHKNKITFSLADSGVASFGKIAEKVGDLNLLLEEYSSGGSTIGSIQLGGESNWLRDKYRSTVMFDIDNGYLDMVNSDTGRGLVLSSLGITGATNPQARAATSIPYLAFKNGGGVPLLEFDDTTAIIRSSDNKLSLDLESDTLTFRKDDDNTLIFNAKDNSTAMKVNSFELKWDGGFSVGKLSVSNDGTVYYNGVELSELISQIVGD